MPSCPDQPAPHGARGSHATPPRTGPPARPWIWGGLLGLLALAAWWGIARGSDDALARARQAGVIRIGYAVEAPFAFLNAEGEVTGEAPEIARIITARLGIARVEWRMIEFGELIDGLEARRFDVIAAGMFITPERQQRVDFSHPTFRAGAALLVGKGNPLALHSYADALQSSNARVAVLSGSAEEARLRELGCPEQRLVRVPDAASGREAVRAGQVAALALSAPTIRWMVLNPLAGRTEMAEPFADDTAPPSLGGFVFRKSDPALRRAWNAELAGFLGGEEHRRLVRRFGFAEAELPPVIPAPGSPLPR